MITTDVVIVGAGPCGLFQVFELGLLGLKSEIVDSIRQPGGQCTELYPDKPIYDIPAIPVCTGEELTASLLKQIEPFDCGMHLGEEVTVVRRNEDDSFHVETSAGTEFTAKAVVIAGGVGSFQPRQIRLPDVEAYVDKSLHYRVRNPEQYWVDPASDQAMKSLQEKQEQQKQMMELQMRQFEAQQQSLMAISRY